MNREQTTAVAPDTESRRPARLTAAAAVTAAEGLVVAVLGASFLVMGMLGHPEDPQMAETGGITMLALSALPLFAARGLVARRRWARGPALITQLMALPVAWTLIGNSAAVTAGGIVLGLAAVLVIALLVNPTATVALGIGREADR
ncbi:hypothetical protein [Streptomyces meridianus]|uniref:Integral membrane protein n=1 Tax=Streptomyces meridianus TaxID=2938945 RepID=A0ABT0X0M0_9ACTN|nr:hypothetical protein [Streptomyces meridianus]MCM2576106.1 hypothetical protein [Streptomyces meridianus]